MQDKDPCIRDDHLPRENGETFAGREIIGRANHHTYTIRERLGGSRWDDYGHFSGKISPHHHCVLEGYWDEDELLVLSPVFLVENLDNGQKRAIKLGSEFNYHELHEKNGTC